MRFFVHLALPVALLAADPASFTIGTRSVQATIVPEKGGEMGSLKVRHKGAWVETLYRAMDYSDKPGWTGKAPFLWPATGRNFPKDVQPNEQALNSSYDWEGKRLPMPIHGFARDMAWKVESRHSNRATLSLAATPETRKGYPFDWRIRVAYEAKGPAVVLTYAVTADAANQGPMPFSAGNHITFRTPLLDGTDPQKMVFETPSTVEFLKAASVPTGATRPLSYSPSVTLDAIPPLAAVSLGGYRADPHMTLRDPGGLTLRIAHTADSIPPDPVIRFNVWGDPKNGYFSPEPWVGLQNSFNLRKGLVWLEPGKTWTWRVTVSAESR